MLLALQLELVHKNHYKNLEADVEMICVQYRQKSLPTSGKEFTHRCTYTHVHGKDYCSYISFNVIVW